MIKGPIHQKDRTMIIYATNNRALKYMKQNQKELKKHRQFNNCWKFQDIIFNKDQPEK